MHEYNNQIGEVMRRRGLTQIELARAMGIEQGNLSRLIRYPRGKNMMIGILIDAARILDVPSYYLMPDYPLPHLEPFSREHIAAIAPLPVDDPQPVAA